MRTRQTTVPDGDLLDLIAKRCDQPTLPDNGAARAAVLIQLLEIADAIHAQLGDRESGWMRDLETLGVEVKTCRECGKRFAANAVGRPRKYCSRTCADRA